MCELVAFPPPFALMFLVPFKLSRKLSLWNRVPLSRRASPFSLILNYCYTKRISYRLLTTLNHFSLYGKEPLSQLFPASGLLCLWDYDKESPNLFVD